MTDKAKSLLTVPDNKHYNPKVDFLTLLIIGIICLIGTWVVLGSCNATRRAYKGIENHEPKTTADTTRLLNRAKTVLKTPAPKVLPGGVVTKYIPKDRQVKVLDSAKLKSITDSLQDVYKDLQLDNVVDCTRQVNEAFNTGYKYAMDKCNKTTFTEKLPDTVLIPDPSAYDTIALQNIKIRELAADGIKYQTESNIYKGQSSKKNWIILILACLLSLSVWFHVKRIIPKSILQ